MKRKALFSPIPLIRTACEGARKPIAVDTPEPPATVWWHKRGGWVMTRARILLASIGLLMMVGCNDQVSEPRLQDTATARALLLDASAQADVINLNFVSIATGRDAGPQDGIFDSFTSVNLGSVNNNGYTSFRTAFEFSLSDLPTGSAINTAELIVRLGIFKAHVQ